MPFAVCFRNRADRLTRVAVRQKAGGNIFGDHAVHGAHDGTVGGIAQ